MSFRCQLKARPPAVQGAGAGGGNRAGPSCRATGRPRTGLAGWASSMERLIPGRTQSVPVVLPELQEHNKGLRLAAANSAVMI